RHDARPWAQLSFQDGTKLLVHPSPEKQRDHGGGTHTGREDIFLEDFHAPIKAKLLDAFLGFFREPGVNLDAHGARAELLGRHDDDATVAGAKVINDIVGAHLCDLKHLFDDGPGSGDVRGKMMKFPARCRSRCEGWRTGDDLDRSQDEEAKRNQPEPPPERFSSAWFCSAHILLCGHVVPGQVLHASQNFGRVIAPSEAEETSEAYLANTPVL